MYFNTFAPGTDEIDMTGTDEFESLIQGATQFGISFTRPARYISRNIVANRMRLHLLEWGDPSSPAVLLLHGGNHTAHTWDFVSLALSRDYHVYALDQRGHGDSEWPRDGDMSISALVDDLSQVVEILGLEGARFVAHSMGGRATMPYLTRNPVAERLVLVDVAPAIGGRGVRGGGRAQPEAVNMNAVREFASLDAYVESVQRIDPNRSREMVMRTMRYNMIQRIDGTLIPKTAARNIANDAAASDPLDSPTVDEVNGIHCKVLLLRGEESPLLSQEGAQEYVNALPNARLVVVPKTGHNIHTQNTLGFLAELTPFLAE